MKSGINNINWNFDNSYSKLPESFKEHIKPIKVKRPELVLLNEGLAKELDLNFSHVGKEELSALFAGNVLPENSNTIAQAYAGHQFGNFTMLGDGRESLLENICLKIKLDMISNLKDLEKQHFQEMVMAEQR